MGFPYQIDCDCKNALAQDHKATRAPIGYVSSLKIGTVELKQKWQRQENNQLSEAVPKEFVAVCRGFRWLGDCKAPLHLELAVPSGNKEAIIEALSVPKKMDKQELELELVILQYDTETEKWVEYIFEAGKKAVKGRLFGDIDMDPTRYSADQDMFPVDFKLTCNGKDVFDITRNGEGNRKLTQRWGVKKQGE